MNTNSPSSIDNKKNTSNSNSEFMRGISSDDNKSAIVDIIKKLQKYEDCIFRGENEEYKKVSSTLYRKYFEKRNSQIIDYKDSADSNYSKIIKKIETNLTEQAKTHIEGAGNNKALTELQHYGGKTNLIDFTYNILIALFFACNSEPQKNGRIIIFNTKGVPEKKDVSKNNTQEQQNTTNQKDEKLFIVKPTGKSPRVVFQSSVFIKVKEGYLDKNKYKCETIKSDEKQEILKILKKDFNIKPETIYNDIHGFIRNKKAHPAEQELYVMGLEYLNNKEFDEAILYFIRAIEINPKYIEAYRSLGVAKLAIGNKEGSKKAYDEAVKIISREAAIYRNLGEQKSAIGDKAGSKKAYDEAFKIISREAAIYRNLGDQKSAIGDKAGSKKAYDEAFRMTSKNAEAYYNQGMEKLKLDLNLTLESSLEDKLKALVNTEEAIKDFNQSIKLGFKNAELYMNLGYTKSFIGYLLGTLVVDKTISSEYYKEALSNMKNKNVLLALKKYTESLSDYNQAINKDSQNAEAYYYRGIVHLILKKNEEAKLNFGEGNNIMRLSTIKTFNLQPNERVGIPNVGALILNDNKKIDIDITKLFIGDKEQAISDLKIAKRLFEKQVRNKFVNIIEKILQYNTEDNI